MEKLSKETLKFVIVGHIDHGKSTLIGRLFYDTGSLPEERIEEVRKVCEALGKEMEFAYVMDHLEEERDQGITIDTAQTFFKTKKRDYVIIDAPGHREFTKNMITGASQAEAAILIVDAEEGVKEQTRRHAYILKMLGLEQVIVVINKMDLVDYKEERYKEVVNEVKEFLNKIGVKPSYMIPVSSKEGDNIAKESANMKWYSGLTVLQALDTFKSGKDRSYLSLRMPVQDVYKIGEKRILVGRVESGMIRQGDEIVVLPSKERTRVLSVEEFLNDDKREAVSGESTGIVLENKLFVDRGNVISNGELPLVTRNIKANIFWMSKSSLKKGETVILKCATQEVNCKVEKIEKRIDSSTLGVIGEDVEEIGDREVGEVILKSDKDLVVDDFNKTPEIGRFVIDKNLDTAGGGIITELK